MSRQLQPILYHYFSRPLPYVHTWAFQERIHQIQLQDCPSSNHPDVLLLLQHRPTYTAGRRQIDVCVIDDRARLQSLGADFVTSTRGGQMTYHGPGQIVGYPLIDLARYTPEIGVRDYVYRLQKLLETHLLKSHAIQHSPSKHLGVFIDPTKKIGSIGIQIRRGLTSHGFSLNITREPLPWFDQIISCGLEGVKAVSVESTLQKPVDINEEVSGIVQTFGDIFERNMAKLDLESGGDIPEAILALENYATEAGDWLDAPRAIT